jgi:hypothetical protein
MEYLGFRFGANAYVGAQNISRGVHAIVDDLYILKVGILNGQHRHSFGCSSAFDLRNMRLGNLQQVNVLAYFIADIVHNVRDHSTWSPNKSDTISTAILNATAISCGFLAMLADCPYLPLRREAVLGMKSLGLG